MHILAETNGKVVPKMKARRKLQCLSIIVLLLITCSVKLQAQSPSTASPQEKEVAVTIDDLPLNGQRIEIGRVGSMTGKLLDAIQRHKIPVVGFVNESL